MRAARRIVISGRVQGVGFRFFAEEAARREGIHGWIANRTDGTVEVFAEGESESVQRFEHQLRHGPPAARVDHVEADDDVPSHRTGGFVVRS
ncbi:MAG: acylphosphatase [Vicinamibacterales bacterium]